MPDGSATPEGHPPLPRHELRHPDGRRLWVYGRLGGALPTERAPAVADVPASASLHQRYDALTNSWIAISPSRNARPLTARSPGDAAAVGCPLCPGGPEIPFPFDAAVFENRWPSLVPDPPPVPDASDAWFGPSLGASEVIVYTSEHEGSIATLDPDELAGVVAIWLDRTSARWADPRMRFVMAFENRGELVGATIAHPHGQLFGFAALPPLIEGRVEALARHREATGDCLTCAVVEREHAAAERTIDASAGWHVGVPFAARWPYEVHIRARNHGVRRLADLDVPGRMELARLLRRTVLRYDGLYGFDLPYMMVIMEAPAEAPDHHLAIEFWPPHRSKHRTKVRASVETATGLFINDTLPEVTAAALRAILVPDRVEATPVDVEPAAAEPASAGARRSNGRPR